MGPSTVAGIVWHRQKDYERLKRMFPDGWKLDDTFEDWLKNVQRLYGVLTAQGITVIKAYIDPETFPEWCEAKGIPMDEHARSEYASDYARKEFETKRASRRRGSARLR